MSGNCRSRRFCSDYNSDATFRGEFHRWLGQVWEEKDEQIATMLAQAARP
jgi:hypothetical protein